MNMYPEQLAGIQRLIGSLDKVMEGEMELDSEVDLLPYALPVVDSQYGTETLLGFVVDEVGGSYSFVPVGTEMAAQAKARLLTLLEQV